METETRTRYALKSVSMDGAWWIHALQPLTNPSWTDTKANAKTWASKAAARAAARKFRLVGLVEVVEVHK
jgi:hypothetical protein